MLLLYSNQCSKRKLSEDILILISMNIGNGTGPINFQIVSMVIYFLLESVPP